MLQVNYAYIIPDFIQNNLENYLIEDDKFYCNLTLYRGDDIRIEILNRNPYFWDIFDKYIVHENQNHNIEKLRIMNYKIKQLLFK